MKFKILCTIVSILAIITGIFCVLAPACFLSNYNVSLPEIGLVIFQFWGAALIGFGMLIWLARGTKDPGLQRKYALVLFIANGLSCVMAVRGQFAGANTFGWSTVGIFLLLSLSSGIFMFIKPRIR
ncbi:MAG: hypothetical protein JXB00_00040 [Bacteroidales bacterium]|nr:hypothetical protein [Bacteroidales bacterium]